MRRYVLPAHITAKGRHTLSGKDFHYLCRVLRSTPGQAFDAVDGRGDVCRCTVLDVGRDSCTVEIAGMAPVPPDGARITLYQALPKGRKLDQIIRQTTEAGVTRIVPFSSAFCVADTVSGKRLAGKLERWHAVAREAVQQSGRLCLPQVEPPITLEQIPSVADADTVGLLFHQQPLEQQTLHGYLKRSPRHVMIVIGAEGGFSPDEVEFLRSRRGFMPVHLGTTVLRCETAALYAVAAVQTILRESEAWLRN